MNAQKKVSSSSAAKRTKRSSPIRKSTTKKPVSGKKSPTKKANPASSRAKKPAGGKTTAPKTKSPRKAPKGLAKPITLRRIGPKRPGLHVRVTKPKHKDLILILDFGSQYTQLIARRIREHKVFSRIVPCHITPDEIRRHNPKGLIFSGGPMSVYDQNAPKPHPDVFKLGLPILGICYGMQLMAVQFGGKVERSKTREFGQAELFIDSNRDLFANLPTNLTVWMSHSDHITQLPAGFTVLAHTLNAPYAAIANRQRKLFGVQFHPEVAHTQRGDQILANFAFHICGCLPRWNVEKFADKAIKEIKERVGKKKVVLGLSGGVDSSVTAVLLHKAIGKQLVCIFVDNGLLRKRETEAVVRTFKNHFKMKLIVVDAGQRFLKRLQGVEDPEEKRKIIGAEFIKVFEETAKQIRGVGFLAQGTLYPDVIESVSPLGGPSAKIKSHHNVGGLPKALKLELIEPLRELFKDEVRKVGKSLGVPDAVLNRQPFPGPGLAVRIIGEVTRERLDLLREADERVLDEIKKAGLYDEIWQSFAVLLPIKTVGVMGDQRTYEHVIAIRCVTSVDGMTADWARLPHEVLARMANRIINEVKGVNRVVYDISSKPPATIEWE